ncbi:kinectin [Trichonephila clavipes]|nr:kinectin [Trichonephila clavipes]
MEEMHHLARERISMASEKMNTRYARATGHDFHEGDNVWLCNPKRRKELSPKLQTNWEGPYTVLKRLNDVVVRIEKSPQIKPKVDLVAGKLFMHGRLIDTRSTEVVAPLRHGVNVAINHELGILSHSSRRALPSSWKVCGGGWWPATRLPRASQTFYIASMSVKHAGHSIRTIPSSKRKSSTRSEDLIPISASSQKYISNDVEVCGPVNGDATMHQQSPTAKSVTFVHERRIIPTATVPPNENAPIIRMNRKTGLVRKKNIAPFISPPVHVLCSPSLRSRRCLDVSLTHTIGRRTYRPTPWSRFRTV